MSKVTTKARYVQLKEWLAARGTKASTGRKRTAKFSKANHYNSKR